MYTNTRGPWTAPACPDKLFQSFFIPNFLECPLFFWEFANSKAVLSVDGCKKALFPPSIVLIGGIGTKWNPIKLNRKDASVCQGINIICKD